MNTFIYRAYIGLLCFTDRPIDVIFHIQNIYYIFHIHDDSFAIFLIVQNIGHFVGYPEHNLGHSKNDKKISDY